MARLLAQGYIANLGQSGVVDNRGGASGAIAAQAVAKSPPDAYTLLFYSNGMWTLPLLQDVPYDAVKDFVPVVCVTSSPNIVVAHPSPPVKSISELIALAKSRPGELNCSMGGTGTTPHLAAELRKSIASYGLFAPARTPVALVQRLNEETLKLLNTPDVKQKLFNISVEVVGGSPDAFAAMIKLEISKWGKVIRDAGIRDQ